MSYFKVGDPETLVECPYNKTHMIRNKRMQYHLIDCRKQHTGQEMKVCPYNAKHIHPKAEHAFHLVYCTDRELIDRDIIFSCAERQDCLPKGLTGNTSLPAYTLPASNVHMQTDEDWDSDACAAPFSLANINSLAFTQPRRTGTDTSAVRLPRDMPTAERPTQSQSNTGPLGQSQELVALTSDFTAKQSRSCSALASLAQQQNSRSSALADVRLPRTKETVPAALSPPQPTAVGTGVTNVTNGVGSGTTQASVTPAVEPPRVPAAAAINDSIPSSIHLNLNLSPVGRGRGSMFSMMTPGSAVGRGSLSASTVPPPTRPGLVSHPGLVSQPGFTAHAGPPGLSGPRLGGPGPSLNGLSGPSLTGLSGPSLTGLVGLGRGQMILASRQQLSMQLTNSTLTSTSAATTTTNTTTNTAATTTTTTTTNTAATTTTTTTTNPIKQQVARQATVTPAFNLTAPSVQSTFNITSGVGRGYAGHSAAPSARDLPLPVFGAVRGQTVKQ